MRITEGHGDFKPDALVMKVEGPFTGGVSTYEFSEVGYLKTDDWDAFIEPSKIMAVIQENTNKSNAHRAPGYPNIHIDGWVVEPKLDRTNAMVYWAIKHMPIPVIR